MRPRFRVDKGGDIERLIVVEVRTSQRHLRFDESGGGRDAMHFGSVGEAVRTPQRREQIALCEVPGRRKSGAIFPVAIGAAFREQLLACFRIGRAVRGTGTRADRAPVAGSAPMAASSSARNRSQETIAIISGAVLGQGPAIHVA